jgi:hypothetical protein
MALNKSLTCGEKPGRGLPLRLFLSGGTVVAASEGPFRAAVTGLGGDAGLVQDLAMQAIDRAKGARDHVFASAAALVRALS